MVTQTSRSTLATRLGESPTLPDFVDENLNRLADIHDASAGSGCSVKETVPMAQLSMCFMLSIKASRRQ